MTRALRCDGLLPNLVGGGPDTVIEPDHVRAMLTWLRDRGGAGAGFDFIVEGETESDNTDQALRKIGPLAEAGATWWLETRWEHFKDGADRMRVVRERIEASPPGSR